MKCKVLKKEDDLEIPAPTRHMVFSGNPGTGKTTWARLIGKIYKATGLLENASVTEVGPGDLIAGYIGQTREKAQKVFKKAMGGILFIDEAYGLTGADKRITICFCRAEGRGTRSCFNRSRKQSG